MSLCINPVCPKPNNPDNYENRFCQSCGSQLELLGSYRVMHLLSDKTGFSKVYEAYEQDTPKVLKVLQEDLSSDTEAVELFQQEVSILGHLNHPGIPKADNYFQYQTRNGLVLHCMVMEKIEGLNLEQWLQQNHPISQEMAIAWLRQLTEILDVVHGKKYMHRDIKPSNIIIRSPLAKVRQIETTDMAWSDIVLIDFGTARKITRTCDGMTAMMSSGYSAPEQMNGQAVPQSDLFALGRTFVFLLTGNHPLDMYNIPRNLLDWHNHATHISPLLLHLIDRLMAPEVEKRPANAHEILQELEEIERELTGSTAVNLNKIEIYKPENLALSTSDKKVLPEPKQEKVPILAFFTVVLISLGLLAVFALATRPSKSTVIPNYGQSPNRKGKIDYFAYKEGKDSQGRTAKFNIAVLSVEYKWLVSSNFQIQYNDQVISVGLLKLNLEEEGIEKLMDESSEIISVGTASCKGNSEVEERKALERSQEIQILAKKLFSNTARIKGFRLLNLGQFLRSDCQAPQDLTAYQRSIIIIGVKQKTAGVILDEALRDRLENKPFADFKLKDYSLGSVENFKTIPSNL
ncbi:serine/threonine-protein kinase [Nostoc sp. UHCC 0302]|uniref:serine/threonine protein kinase n=1 Tax=Nostoc sp. UHCC 0302 TaxID=3134896 RepID=UPI00311CB194